MQPVRIATFGKVWVDSLVKGTSMVNGVTATATKAVNTVHGTTQADSKILLKWLNEFCKKRGFSLKQWKNTSIPNDKGNEFIKLVQERIPGVSNPFAPGEELLFTRSFRQGAKIVGKETGAIMDINLGFNGKNTVRMDDFVKSLEKKKNKFSLF